MGEVVHAQPCPSCRVKEEENRRLRERVTELEQQVGRLEHAKRDLGEDLEQAKGLLEKERRAGKTPEALGVAVERLRAQMKRLLAGRPHDTENRKLANHLRNEEQGLFTFLEQPAVPATNHRAEQALRPAVVIRKPCGGGNRSWKGAAATAIIATILRTSRQQGKCPREIFTALLRSPHPTVALALLHPRLGPSDSRPPPAS